MKGHSSRRAWILGLGGMAATGAPPLSQAEVQTLLLTVGDFYAQGSVHASVRVRVNSEVGADPRPKQEFVYTLHRSGNRLYLSVDVGERWISILGADRAWRYHIEAREYLEVELSSKTAADIRGTGHILTTRFVDRFALLPKIDSQAQFLKWEHHRNKSGKRLCAVVRLSVRDPNEQHWTERLWIEPDTGIVWKLIADLKGRVLEDRLFLPASVTTVWDSIVLGEPPDPTLFVFRPPAGVSRVDRFSVYHGR